MPRKFTIFEIAVLNSLFRIENRQRQILDGICELLHEGPNDPGTLARIKESTQKLDAAASELQAAINTND
jgi:hypothetical protein